MLLILAETVTDGADLFTKLAGATGATVLAFVVVGFIRGWIVPGYLYTAAVERAQKAEEKAWASIQTMNRAIETTQKVTDKVIESSTMAPK